MKKITLLTSLLFISIYAFAQTPVITMIADGDCTGGTPKVVEIYADGTVDFSQYTMQNQTNSNSTWGADFNLAPFGTVTDDFIYIYHSTGNGATGNEFAQEFPSATNAETSAVASFNGDDRIRIIEVATGNTIDQYGVDSTDGTGETWEYKDGYAKRNNGTYPNGTFTENDWTFYNGGLDGEGSCNGGSIYETIINTASYTTAGGTTNPVLTITAPTDGQIFNPNTTSVNASFNVQNFNVGNTATSDGYISWVLNSTTTPKYDTADETINVSAGNSYTLTAELLDFNGNPLNPAVTQTVNFSVANYTPVASIQALRDLPEDTYAEFTGEATITFLQNFRNQKYIEDATAAILIDDTNDVLTNTYAIGDNITGLKGLVGAHNGIAQFYPVEDIATIVSNGNTITPQTVTIADFMANYNDYESELIAIENVTITGDTNVFTNGSNYTITENTGDSSVLRTNFYNVDFIGTNLPTEEISFVAGIAAHYNGKGQIFPRDLNDFGEVLSTDNIQAQGVSIYPNPANTYVNIQTANNQAVNVAIYNLLGQEVLTQNNVQNTVNLEGLQKGLYIIKVSNAHVNFTQKLIVK